MGSADPPGKSDEKLKRKHAKRAVFWMGVGIGCHWPQNYVYVIFWEQSGQAGVDNGSMLTTYRSMLTTYLFRYFRMHHFVVKFSNFSSPQAARGHWSPNQTSWGRPGKCHLLKSHNEGPSFTCEKCCKKFSLCSQFKAHLFRHEAVRLYVCDECPKRYYTVSQKNKTPNSCP